MASGDANTSMCASTGASSAGTVAVGTGHSEMAEWLNGYCLCGIFGCCFDLIFE